ncbi:MAG TPA: hypothetical protein VNJ04_14570 [Gemmatimonadaceae bacterium]|nr:hypothetical protein [Gemmatimonadaceae bacterium]
MQKLAGVESVKVSLNEGRARLVLKTGNALTMAQLRKVVEQNGFTPKQAGVVAEAEIVAKDGLLQVRILGVSETYGLEPTTAGSVAAELRKHAGRTVRVEGVIAPPADKMQKPLMQVTSVREIRTGTGG